MIDAESETVFLIGAASGRRIGQPDHCIIDSIMSHRAERWPWPREIWLAVTKHDGMQVDSILIDQTKFGEAMRQVRAGNFDLPVDLGLQLADRALKITLNKPGVEGLIHSEHELSHSFLLPLPARHISCRLTLSVSGGAERRPLRMLSLGAARMNQAATNLSRAIAISPGTSYMGK